MTHDTTEQGNGGVAGAAGPSQVATSAASAVGVTADNVDDVNAAALLETVADFQAERTAAEAATRLLSAELVGGMAAKVAQALWVARRLVKLELDPGDPASADCHVTDIRATVDRFEWVEKAVASATSLDPAVRVELDELRAAMAYLMQQLPSPSAAAGGAAGCARWFEERGPSMLNEMLRRVRGVRERCERLKAAARRPAGGNGGLRTDGERVAGDLVAGDLVAGETPVSGKESRNVN